MSEATKTSNKRTVLIVEDEPTIAKSIASVVQHSMTATIASNLEEGRSRLGEIDDLAALISDVMLPDGSGIDFVEEFRESHPVAPVLIVTGQVEADLINRAHSLRAEYVCKPHFQDNLKAFLRRVVQPAGADQQLTAAAEAYASQHKLSVRETEILGLATSGIPRARIAGVLGVSENTIKTQIRSILDKTQKSSLSDVVWTVRQAPELQ